MSDVGSSQLLSTKYMYHKWPQIQIVQLKAQYQYYVPRICFACSTHIIFTLLFLQVSVCRTTYTCILMVPVLVYENQSSNYTCKMRWILCTGRNGDTIRQLSRQSRAKIVIDRSEQRDPNSLTSVTLQGTPEAVEIAKVFFISMSC